MNDAIRSVVLREIERCWEGWEAALDLNGHMTSIERVWYGRLDEAAAVAIQLGVLSPEQEDMLARRMELTDPSLGGDRFLQDFLDGKES